MIDILMATYNGEKYIGEQLDSILNQTYQDFRILIRDDGSTDNTLSIIKRYIESFPTKLSLIIDDKICRSAAKNFFQLVKYAESEFVMFSDQDDVWLPDKIEIMLKCICKDEFKNTPVCGFTNYSLIDGNSNDILYNREILKSQYELKKLLSNNCALGCTMLLNDKLIDLLKKWTYTERTMHDWAAMLIAACCGKIIYLPERTICYRQHNNNVLGKKTLIRYVLTRLSLKEDRKRIDNYFIQAEYLKHYCNNRESLAILNDFCNIREGNKLHRIYSLIKKGFLSGNIIKKAGMLLII